MVVALSTPASISSFSYSSWPLARWYRIDLIAKDYVERRSSCISNIHTNLRPEKTAVQNRQSHSVKTNCTVI